MKKVLRVLLAAIGLLALFSALQLCFAAWGRPYESGGKIRVVDHVVYYRSGQSYAVVDYFDTDAAAANATAITIRSAISMNLDFTFIPFAFLYSLFFIH